MGCASSTPRDDASSGARGGGGARAHDVADVMPSATPARLQRVKTNPMDDYYDVDAIGAGGFAVVRKVRHKTTAETYAMKIIGVKEDDDKTEDKGEHGKERMSMSEVTSEIDILRVLKSPNVLRLKEVTWFGDNVYVVTELLRGGAVLDAILRMKDERYTEAEAKLVIKRTLLGIDFMHKSFVLHRDLKLENLLLRSSEDLNSVVIADFGLARR
jgi:calcium/calmodulin-dependent protein kinase I